MPFPKKIVSLFELSSSGGYRKESEWYGPFNALLNYVFPIEEDYVVVPQYRRPEDLKSEEFTTIFVVRHKSHPVFFITIKPTCHIQYLSNRKEADQQTVEQLNYLFDFVKIPKLYGISALGTRICLYAVDMDTGHIVPEGILRDPNRITDTNPAHRWSLDILTQKGEDRFQEVVTEIKSMCRQE